MEKHCLLLCKRQGNSGGKRSVQRTQQASDKAGDISLFKGLIYYVFYQAVPTLEELFLSPQT